MFSIFVRFTGTSRNVAGGQRTIASKLVKEIARLDGDVSKFVTPLVNQKLKERLG